MAGAMLPGGAATIANGPCEARPGCFRSGGSDPHSATGYDGADRRPGHFAIGSRRPRTGESPDPDHDPRSSTFIDWRSNSAACGHCGHCSRSTTARFVKSLNLEYTYMNALTSLGTQGAKILSTSIRTAARSRRHWLSWRLLTRRRCAWCGLPIRSTWSAFKPRRPVLGRRMDTP
jgi:hypothetical protein